MAVGLVLVIRTAEGGVPRDRGLPPGYNDTVDQDQRQDLYAYASKVVCTRGDRAVTLARRDHCLRWVAERAGKRPPRFKLLAYVSHPVTAGQQAAQASIHPARPDSHVAALAFLDELIHIGGGFDLNELSEEFAGPLGGRVGDRAEQRVLGLP